MNIQELPVEMTRDDGLCHGGDTHILDNLE